MSFSVNLPCIILSTSTLSLVMTSFARSTSAFRSPMPSSREMNPSGSNRSRSSGVSPTPMKAMDVFVSETADNAPPPLAVPSSLVITTPVTPIAVVEHLRLLAGLLADGRIEHQELVGKRGERVDIFHFLDEVLLQRVTSGGIDDPDVVLRHLLEAVADDLDRVFVVLLAVERDAQLFA